MEANKPRVFYIDVIRAFAILTIVVCHGMMGTVSEKWASFVGLFIGSASLFFMTSGALIFPVAKAGPFLRRRLTSFLPQFVIWSLIYVLLEYMSSGDGAEATKQVGWFLFSPTFSVGWFCYAMTGLCFFAPIISPWLAGAGKRAVEWFLLAWLLSGLIPVAQLYTYMRPLPEQLLGPFYGFMGYMVAGYYLMRWPIFSRPRRERLAFWAVAICVGVFIAGRFYFTLFKYGVHQPITYDLSINIMLMCMLWFALCQRVRKAPRIVTAAVTMVSVCSLEIYLCHIAWKRYVVDVLGLDAWLSVILLLVLSVGTALALRVVWHRFTRPLLVRMRIIR